MSVKSGAFAKAVVCNQRGQSLISVLVAVGVMGIVLMGIASMQTNQSRENRALMEKLASAELTRLITTTLNRSTTCNMMFSKTGNVVNSGALSFTDSSASFPFSVTLKSVPFDKITDAVSLSTPSVSTISPTLQVKPDGIYVDVVNATSGVLQIKFDQSKLVRPIADLSFPITLATTASGSTRTIQGCVSVATASSPDAPCPVSTAPAGYSIGSHVYAHIPTSGGLTTEAIGPCLNLAVTDGKVPFGSTCQSNFQDGSTSGGATANGKVVTCMGGKWVLTGYNPPPPPAPTYPGGF